MTELKKTVPIGYNGYQLTQTPQIDEKNDNYLLAIDYLIVNLSTPESCAGAILVPNDSEFEMRLNEIGTRTFKNRFEVLYKSNIIGTFLSQPHSAILKPEFCQFQFENHLFYTLQLSEIGSLLRKFTDTFNLNFDSINRLDICLDLENTNDFYQKVFEHVLTGSLLVAGKDKKISPHFTTKQGKRDLQGFSIGSRSSSRFLRCYNKTLEMTQKPKEYILNAWNVIGFDVQNVWRFEYQLNNSFFRTLVRAAIDKNITSATEPVTWAIFYENTLFHLIALAQKNHFELRYNTGKSQINKEMEFNFINWNVLKSRLTGIWTEIVRIKKLSTPTLLGLKRLMKATFREYYNSKQTNITYILALNNIINDYDNSLTLLNKWFHGKYHWYIDEFKKKQLEAFEFDFPLFNEHLTYDI